ncbi:MAG: hypothetical protein AAF268_04825, partial [Cyanobacteria bacterium P01_A01_bin.3]
PRRVRACRPCRAATEGGVAGPRRCRESVLTVLGLDNLADYGEFVIQSDVVFSLNDAVATLTTVV